MSWQQIRLLRCLAPRRDAVSSYFLLLRVVTPTLLTTLLTTFRPRSPVLLTGPACALGAVLLWPRVKAWPPLRKLLIAMPGLVFVTV